MKQRSTGLFILALMLMAACQHRALPPTEYDGYIRKPANGLTETEDVDGYRFSIQLYPAEYMAFLELRNDQFTPLKWNETVKEFEEIEYYLLRISYPDSLARSVKASVSDQTISYLSFGMQKDVYLIAEQDTIECEVYHFERDFNMTPSWKFMIGFPKDKLKQDVNRTLWVNNRMIETGPVEISLDGKSVANIPKLKTY